MSDPRDVVVTGLGAVSSVGRTAIQTCAAVRAGVNRFGEFEDFLPRNAELNWEEEEPMKGARVPWLGLDAIRIPQLLLSALEDLTRTAPIERGDLAGTALHVGLPPAERPGTERDPDALRAFIDHAVGGGFSQVTFHAAGNVASLVAMDAAASALAEGRAARAIVAGVDSYHDIDTLEWLDDIGRLRSDRSRDGFMPGEAAAALLLEPRSQAEARQAEVLARLAGFSCANVPPSDFWDGEGLWRVLDPLVTAEAELRWAACDLNGQVERAREWGMCQVRLGARARGFEALWHPADCLGDVGAASGAILTALVCRAFQRGYAPADHCFVWTACDSGARAGQLLQRP